MITSQMAFVLGAVAGFVGLNTRARVVVQLAPLAFFLLEGVRYFASLELPFWLSPALAGMALVVLILRGGK